jgi:hypothetical protein
MRRCDESDVGSGRERVVRAAVVLALLVVSVWLLPAAAAHGPKTISTGTVLRVRVETKGGSSVRAGDAVRAVTIEVVSVGGEAAIPAGSVLGGHVASVEAASAGPRSAEVRVAVDRLRSPRDVSVDVEGELRNRRGEATLAVEDLADGVELHFTFTKPVTVGEAFSMGDGEHGQGDQPQ